MLEIRKLIPLVFHPKGVLDGCCSSTRYGHSQLSGHLAALLLIIRQIRGNVPLVHHRHKNPGVATDGSLQGIEWRPEQMAHQSLFHTQLRNETAGRNAL